MARTDNCFEDRLGNYIAPTNPLGMDFILTGTNKYHNWGSVVGVNGYGIRDNSGVMEFKDLNGSWLAITNAVTGANAALSNLSSVAINTALLTIDGTVGAPAYSWTTDATCGLYHTGTGATSSILAAINGTKVWELTNTALKTTGLSVVMGAAALATNATTGFCYIPTCAGVPTGVPVAQSGTAAIVFDTTNSKLMIYAGSSW